MQNFKLLAAHISIHAPSRERRIRRRNAGRGRENFNPRSLAGATLVLVDVRITQAEFQSTLPRGSDEQQVTEV